MDKVLWLYDFTNLSPSSYIPVPKEGFYELCTRFEKPSGVTAKQKKINSMDPLVYECSSYKKTTTKAYCGAKSGSPKSGGCTACQYQPKWIGPEETARCCVDASVADNLVKKLPSGSQAKAKCWNVEGGKAVCACEEGYVPLEDGSKDDGGGFLGPKDIECDEQEGKFSPGKDAKMWPKCTMTKQRCPDEYPKAIDETGYEIETGEQPKDEAARKPGVQPEVSYKCQAKAAAMAKVKLFCKPAKKDNPSGTECSGNPCQFGLGWNVNEDVATLTNKCPPQAGGRRRRRRRSAPTGGWTDTGTCDLSSLYYFVSRSLLDCRQAEGREGGRGGGGR